jgi:sugar O-acyltransferase (sialic acid O-acetyltransferase NeuD family)
MKKALIGAGGFAREIKAHMGDITIKCFVDDQYWKENNEFIFPLSQFNPYEYEVIVAIGDSKDRYDIIQRLPKETQYYTFIHPTALILDNVEIGEGSFIGAYSILTTNIKIGKHALLNRANHIGHDTIIGDFFSIMPGAIISGNVRIYDCVYIGTNSSIKEKISIHSFVTIGLNTGVVKSIKEPGTYIGTPSIKIK